MYNDSDMQHYSQLVLCIEEIDQTNNNSIDNRLFIYCNDYNYELFGKRQDLNNKTQFAPYSFYCDKTSELCRFIKLSIDTTCNITLYNYNNITNLEETELLTYDFFEQMMHKNYEIFAYDNVKITCKNLSPILKMLKHIYT